MHMQMCSFQTHKKQKLDPHAGAAAAVLALHIVRKASPFRDAPPTRKPSTSSFDAMSAAFLSFTEPPAGTQPSGVCKHASNPVTTNRSPWIHCCKGEHAALWTNPSPSSTRFVLATSCCTEWTVSMVWLQRSGRQSASPLPCPTASSCLDRMA